MSDFYQRLRENYFKAKWICDSGTIEETLAIRPDDFCAIYRILYRCYKEDEARQSEQAAQNEKEGVVMSFPITSTCLQIAMDEFLATLQDQNVPQEHYAFKCVHCGNTQSATSLSKYMSLEKALNTAYFCCEGRFTKELGCDWTLGGLLRMHKMEVLIEDKDSAVCGILRAQPIFEPASPEEAQELMQRNVGVQP